MKRNVSLLRTASLLLVLCVCACNKKSEPSRSEAKAPERSVNVAGSFEAVTSHLDRGGDLYVYFGTEQILKGVSGKIAGWRDLISAIPDAKAADRENLQRVLGIVTNLVAGSGIEQMGALGMSSVPREGGIHHTKAMLYHAKGGGSGFFWNLLGREPHALSGLDLLPATTAMAMFSDFDIPLLWSVVEKQVGQSGSPQAQEMLQKLQETFQKSTGLEWDKVLKSLGGEFGFAITLDEEKSVSVPLPGDQRLEFPEPALMLVGKVKDETIFNRIDEAIKKSGQQVFSTEKPNLRMRTLSLPIPLPLQVAPTIAVSGGYLFIASTDAIIQQALAVKSGQKPGLKSTDEFKRLSKDLPQQGNQFTFVSERFSQTVNRVQRKALQAAPAAAAEKTKWLESLLSGTQPPFYYTVGSHTPEGWLWAANGSQPPTKFLLASAIVPAAAMAAVAAPNIVKGLRHSQAGEPSGQ